MKYAVIQLLYRKAIFLEEFFDLQEAIEYFKTIMDTPYTAYKIVWYVPRRFDRNRILDFGEYKGKSISEVPIEYIHYLWLETGEGDKNYIKQRIVEDSKNERKIQDIIKNFNRAQ